MNMHTQVLKELVRESQYVVDPRAVAEAVIVRLMAQRVVPDVSFRSTPKVAEVRSLRPSVMRDRSG